MGRLNLTELLQFYFYLSAGQSLKSIHLNLSLQVNGRLTGRDAGIYGSHVKPYFNCIIPGNKRVLFLTCSKAGRICLSGHVLSYLLTARSLFVGGQFVWPDNFFPLFSRFWAQRRKLFIESSDFKRLSTLATSQSPFI